MNSELEIASVLDAGFTPQDSRAVARQEAAAFGGRHPSNGSKG